MEAIAEMREEEAVKMAREMLDSGYDAIKLLGHCREAMELVGKRYEEGEYFLPELMLAGEMLREIGDMAKPLIKQGSAETKSLGTVVIGTVQGDLHDIGKNIVTFMLEINGYKVVDLGIDVPVENFIQSIKEHKPQVVGLSGFLTLAFDAMKQTVEAMKEAGLRGNVKIMIGGGQVDEAVKNYTGADAFGLNAMDAVSLCKQWVPA
ncbi:MAG TPA: cobalamin-dependent protein [Candidatus Polarisedimenticolia bacterium]|nr:cobalamin-dependent protein [Candidatus Polarisedimenticolia bacterium]